MEEERNKNKIARFFGLFMIVFYIAMAYLLAFSPVFEQSLPSETMRYCAGALLFLYGVFRIWRVFKS